MRFIFWMSRVGFIAECASKGAQGGARRLGLGRSLAGRVGRLRCASYLWSRVGEAALEAKNIELDLSHQSVE